MKVSKEKHGKASVKRPKLKPADTRGADLVVATVGTAVLSPAEGEFRERIKISFTEFPDRDFYLTPDDVDEMCDALGENTDDWEDERVPLVIKIVPNPSEDNVDTPVYRVARASEWKKLIAQFDREKSSRTRRGK